MDNTYSVRVSFDVSLTADFRLEEYSVVDQVAILNQLLWLLSKDFKEAGFELKNLRCDGFRYEWADLLSSIETER